MTRRALLTPLLLLAAMPAWADDPQMLPLTTDTPAYCANLVKQVTDRHSTMPDVQRLLAAGHDLCDRGEVRGGIRRLRRALVILHHRKPPAAAKEPPPKLMSPKPMTLPDPPAPAVPKP